jgi:hypothetical protein
MAAKLDITRFRGDTDPLVFTFSKNKVPLDLTATAFTLSVASVVDPDVATYVLQLHGVITAPLSGVVEFTLSEAQANFIGSYFYDIEFVNGAIKKTVVSGKFKMVQDITK